MGARDEIGFDVRVVEGKLEFRSDPAPTRRPRRATSPAQALQLVWGANLQEFYPRITSAEQVSEVEVRGWDLTTKEELVGTATAATTSVTLPDTPASLSGTTGRERLREWRSGAVGATAVDEAAAAEAERIASSHAEAEGVAFGNTGPESGHRRERQRRRPLLGPLRAHADAPRLRWQGYKTTFQVTGRQDRSLLGLTSGARASNGQRRRRIDRHPRLHDRHRHRQRGPRGPRSRQGQVPGLRRRRTSPTGRASCLPGAGPDSGLVFLPEVDDEVLVAFEHGDIRRPYVIGGLWNGLDSRPWATTSSTTATCVGAASSRARDHKIVFFDDASKSGIALMTGDDKLRISLNQTGGQLSCTATARSHRGRSQGDMTLEAGIEPDHQGRRQPRARGRRQRQDQGRRRRRYRRRADPAELGPRHGQPRHRHGRQDHRRVRHPPDPEPGVRRAAAVARADAVLGAAHAWACARPCSSAASPRPSWARRAQHAAARGAAPGRPVHGADACRSAGSCPAVRRVLFGGKPAATTSSSVTCCATPGTPGADRHRRDGRLRHDDVHRSSSAAAGPSRCAPTPPAASALVAPGARDRGGIRLILGTRPASADAPRVRLRHPRPRLRAAPTRRPPAGSPTRCASRCGAGSRASTSRTST